MVSRAEKAIRRKSDREEKRRKRRGDPESVEDYVQDVIDSEDFGDLGPAPELSPEEEPTKRLDVLRSDGKLTYQQGSETWLEDPPEGTSPALDEFEAEAIASGGFSDEEPQGTFEEEAAEGASGEEFEDESPPGGWRSGSSVPGMGYPGGDALPLPEDLALYEGLSNNILSDTEAQVLGDDATYDTVLEENRLRMERGGRPSEAEERGRAKATAKEADERIYQEELRNAGQGMSFDEALGAPGATDTTRELTQEQKKERVYDQMLGEKTRDNESLAGHLDNANKPWTTGIAPEDSEWIQRGRDNEAAAKAEAEAAAAESEEVIHGKDKASAAEMAARFEARGPGKNAQGTQYQRSAVEPPMTNTEGKKLGSIYYDPMLSEVKNIVDARGVIIDREVVDLEGVREGEDAGQKKKGMVWMIPSKGGFKTGDQRFAGEGAGRWMRPDQAAAADTTNIERPIEEDRRQAMLDKKNRTPLEVREDNLRAKREHEEELKRIEFDKEDGLEDEAKKEMEIKRLQMLLAQPGLTIAQKRLYQQQLNTLLGGGDVGGAAGADGERPAGEHSADLFAADEPLHDKITAINWDSRLGGFQHTDHKSSIGELLISIKDMLDGKEITEANKKAAFAYIASRIQPWARNEIAMQENLPHVNILGQTSGLPGSGPAEGAWGKNIPGYTDNQLYLFFKAIEAGQWPPGYPK